MLRRLYNWTLDLAARPYAFWALAAISFIESSIFPIPPDVVLIAMVIARPAVARGRKVNRTSGEPSSQLHERHEASDFDTRTQDKLATG